MAHEKNHDYHILQPSIWPFFGALSALTMLVGAVLASHHLGRGSEPVTLGGIPLSPGLLILGFLMVLYTMYAWWSEVVKESHVGDHTPVVVIGLRYGVIMFIMSEVMFFVAWFWLFFKNAMYPMGEQSPAIDGTWAEGVHTFDAWHLPLINTLILLCSGCLATWAHHAIAHDNDRKGLIWGLLGAIALGALFTIFQVYEYGHAEFGFRATNPSYEGHPFSGIYGGIFFMATGFHGFHVLVGTIFLAVCLFRAQRGHFTQERHVGFEAAAWYLALR